MLGRWIGGFRLAGLYGLVEVEARAELEAMNVTNGDMAEDPRKVRGAIIRAFRYGISRQLRVTAERSGPARDTRRARLAAA